jgi:hypothetical protein
MNSQIRYGIGMNTLKTLFRSMIMTACLFFFVATTFAQQRPVWQQKSDYLNNGPAGYSASPGGYSAYSAGTRLYDARQYTQQLYDYTQCAPASQLQPVVTKVESEHIGQTIQAAKQNLAIVKTEAEKAGDKAILKKLESIDKHLVSAMEHHKKMHMECCKAEIDGGAAANCCDELMTELDKALAEHASLMRLLGGIASKVDQKPAHTVTTPVPQK